MFDFFGKKKPEKLPELPSVGSHSVSSKSGRPPSLNQSQTCKRLGLEIAPAMNYEEVKQCIEVSIKQEKYKVLYDEIQREREAELEKEDRLTYGDMLYADYKKWKKYRDPYAHYLLVFKRGTSVQAEVVEIDGVEIVGAAQYTLQIDILLPKFHKDKYTDEWIEWEKEVRLKSSQILKIERLPKQIEMNDLNAYHAAKEKCNELAREFVQ